MNIDDIDMPIIRGKVLPYFVPIKYTSAPPEIDITLAMVQILLI